MRTIERIACVAMLAVVAGCAGGAAGKRPADDPDRAAAELQVKLGQGYLNQGELETARDKLQRALELDPRSVDAHTLMGVLQERIGRLEIAEKHYRRAVELKPDGGAVNNNYGTFLCGSGRFAEAREYFDRAVQDVANAARALIDTLVTTAEPRDREIEAARAKARSAARFGTPS